MHKPNLRNFFKYLYARMEIALMGCGVINKVKLSIYAVLDSLPQPLIRVLPQHLQHLIESTKSLLVKEVIINYHGVSFSLLDSVSVFTLMRVHEPWMWDLLRLKRGDVFVDVGAHIGKYSVVVAKVVGENGLVIAIEPHPENYKVLNRNVRLNNLNNVIALNIAAWSKEGKLKLFIGKGSDLHSVKRDHGLGFYYVQAKALDDVLDALNIRKVDYVKIDVEGAELEVLKGMERTLKRFRPIVIVEITENLDEVMKLMLMNGYHGKLVDQDYYIFKPL